MEQHLLEECVSCRIERSRAILRRCCNRYLQGVASEEDSRNILCEDACNALQDILRPFGLQYSITADQQQAFLDEYDAWKNGTPAQSGSGSGWLLYCPREDTSMKRQEAVAAYERIPAPLYAKEQFFRAMDAYRIPVEYFLPLPDSIPDPRAQCTHTYAGSLDYTVVFPCANGDDLFADPDPAGKHFILTHPYGLKADFVVDRVCAEKRGRPLAVTGSIEGYTTGRKRPFDVFRYDERSLWFSLNLDMDDASVFFHFPLWSAYREWAQRRADLLTDCRYQCFLEAIRASHSE